MHEEQKCYQLLFFRWFASKSSAEAAKYIGADLIGLVKNSTKGFCEGNIKIIWYIGQEVLTWYLREIQQFLGIHRILVAIF